MIRKVSYESQERREKQVLAALNANGIKSLEEANQSARTQVLILIRCVKTLSVSASRTLSGRM